MHKSVETYPNITTHTSHPHMADIIVDHSLLEHLRKEELVKDKDLRKKEVYESPKRDNMCVQCGQQLHWCVCYLNDY